MDIISHGLWGALLIKAVNVRLRRKKAPEYRKLDPILAAFWGFAPDLVAFTPVFLLFGGGMLSGHLEPDHLPRPREADPAPLSTLSIFAVTQTIYSFTHSAIVFAAAFFGVWAFRKFILRRRVRTFIWEMSPWLLHIVMDLFTHSYRFYPTPILWPVSAWRFDGVPWSTPWILIPNYMVLILGLYFVRRRRKRAEASEEPTLAPVTERVSR